MCGIAGIVNRKRQTIDSSLLLSLASKLAHRGPDDEKFAIFNSEEKTWHAFKRNEIKPSKGNIGFAHRRLSIIELSELGIQPMCDNERKIWIIHNGEIFNYLELRTELVELGYKFFSQSDTEVIINAYKEWGKDCLNKFNGMWAFVIYDMEYNKIFGARDRFGIKPFYYHLSPQYFSFSSEIKALLKLPWISAEPFLPNIKDYLFHSRTSTSKYTFFNHIHELEAGYFFEIDMNKGCKFHLVKWWDLLENIKVPPNKENEKIERFRDLLLSSIKLRLRSDVPIGTCLSGGLDSSAIVSLSNPLLKPGNQKTFSIIHPGFKCDESLYIDKLTRELNVSSYRISLNGNNLLNEIEQLIYTQDEPFSSTSIYAQWKVFQLAKLNGIKVTLDGQGSDELLAGYPYFKMVYWAELLQNIRIIRYCHEILNDSNSIKDIVFNFLMSFTGYFSHRKMIRLARIKDTQYNLDWLNQKFFKGVPGSHHTIQKRFSSRLNQRLYEVFTYDGLPALLRYADRNSMTHSLEARMPFLDFRLVCYIFSLSSDLKIKNGFNKYILRESLVKDVPKSILSRRDKIGFETPEADWFRNELYQWMEDIINSPSTEKRGYFDIKNLKKIFNLHKKGKINASRPLWRAVNLELWHRKYTD